VENAGIDDVIRKSMQEAILDLDVCMPVEIKSYDPLTLQASVMIEFDIELSDGEVITPEVLQDIPVCFPMSSSSAIIFELQPGDKGVLVVSQRSLDAWKAGIDRTLIDSTYFQAGDGFLIPGVSHRKMNSKFLTAKEGMNVIGEKISIGDPNAIVSSLVLLEGVKSRDVVQILKTFIDIVYQGDYSKGTFDAKKIKTVKALSTELEALIP